VIGYLALAIALWWARRFLPRRPRLLVGGFDITRAMRRPKLRARFEDEQRRTP